MTLCRLVFFWGCSSLSLLAFFSFSPVPFQCLQGDVFLSAGEGGSEARPQRGLSAHRLRGRLQQRGRDRGGLPGVPRAQQGKDTQLPCWLCVLPKLTAGPCEVNIHGFSCWSTPVVCCLSGMKEALSPLRTLLAVMGRKDCQGYLDGSTENTFGGGGVFFHFSCPFSPHKVSPIWILWGSQNQ